MADAEPRGAMQGRGWGPLEPLREKTFRTIWSASVLSNFGQLILGVGAAWEMTSLTNVPSMVALVQTALMIPLMLVAVPAGAIADMFDRRKVALTGLAFATAMAATLTTLALLGYTTPWLLLAFCSLIGVGVAVYSPAWQASVREQVPPDQLPAAVALGSISYNVARSFGPAIGGVIVLLAGAKTAFGINALCYLPLLLAFFLWKREIAPARLPPERIDRAIVSGARYVLHSPPIRVVLIRAFSFGLAGASISALTPLIARDMLHGDAGMYGLLLGAFGVGAVGGAMVIGEVRERMKAEAAVRLFAAITGGMVLVMGVSHSTVVTVGAMLVSGAAWMLLIALLNVAVQLSAPRWVTARALAWYQSFLTGGIAIGAWMWGHATTAWGIETALLVSGAAVIVAPVLGFVFPMPRVSIDATEMREIEGEPEVALALTPRSGPIIVEIDYHVDPAEARDFYGAMLQLQRMRQRNGAFDWSLSRDIAAPELWTERYHCPTWGDYLRLRSRFTHSDWELQAQADAYHYAEGVSRVRRRLERPFGSVRWRAETPDPQNDVIGIYTP